MRIAEYWKVLQPRRMVWFMTFTVGGLGLSGLIGYGVSDAIGSNPASGAIIGVLIALLIILFFSGFNAWDKEQRKTADRWPRLDTAQRVAIADILRPFEFEPEIQIVTSNHEDAKNFAVDLCDVFARATNGRLKITPRVYYFPVASGLRIDAPTDDNRRLVLKTALEKRIRIPVYLERRSNVGFMIFVGIRA